jgi:predicted MFS family arabinose efflux permease
VTAAPSRGRYRVLALACCLAALTYLDRAAFGVASPTIWKELGLNSVADLKGAIVAFAIAYGLFEIPTGWWGDRFGPRRVLIRIVLWWSFFTVLTGLVGWQVAGVTFGGLTFLVAVRFLFGAGEAGAFPNIARSLQNWFPPESRARAQGAVWMSARLMGGLTPLLWTLVVAGTEVSSPLTTWRGAFAIFGMLGVVWCGVFYFTFRDRPPEAARETKSEAEPVPWRAVFFNRNLVCLYLMYFGITYGWYFNMTYLPACLETRYGVEPTSVSGSILKGGPLWLGAVGCLLGGYLSDGLLKRGLRPRWARRWPGLVGLVLCAGCYLAASGAPTAFTFALAISLAAFCNDLVIGGAWSTVQDVGGKHTGVVAACLNVSSSAGAAVAGWCSGLVLDWYLASRSAAAGIAVEDLNKPEWHYVRAAALVDGYEANLLIFAAITAVAAIIWLGADAERPLSRSPAPH